MNSESTLCCFPKLNTVQHHSNCKGLGSRRLGGRVNKGSANTLNTSIDIKGPKSTLKFIIEAALPTIDKKLQEGILLSNSKYSTYNERTVYIETTITMPCEEKIVVDA